MSCDCLGPGYSAWRSVLGTAGLLALIWYFWPQVYDTVRQADRLTVYEGLPHPMYEEEAFHEELKTKQTMQLSGFPFYREPLVLKDEDIKTLRGLLGDRSTYRAIHGREDMRWLPSRLRRRMVIRGKGLPLPDLLRML